MIIVNFVLNTVATIGVSCWSGNDTKRCGLPCEAWKWSCCCQCFLAKHYPSYSLQDLILSIHYLLIPLFSEYACFLLSFVLVYQNLPCDSVVETPVICTSKLVYIFLKQECICAKRIGRILVVM